MTFPSSNPEIHLSTVNVANFVSIKLCGKSNYIPWKTQIVCLLQSHDLFGFVDGTIRFPLLTIAPGDGDDDDDEPEEEEEKGEEMGIDEDYLQRKRSDGFVKGWIFGSLSDELLQDKAVHKLDSAREIWLVLEELYSPTSQVDSSIKRAEGIESKKDFSYYLQLYRASLSGDWKEAEKFLTRDTEASRAQINSLLQTTLHVAVGIKGKKAEYGYISVDVFAYFLSITEESIPYADLSGVRLLNRLIHSDLYDFARQLVEDYPDLAKYDLDGKSALKELAMKEFTFLSGSHLNFWQQLLYYCVPVKLTSRSRQRKPNANDLENVVNNSQMVKTKSVRIYIRTVIKTLHSLLFNFVEILVPPLKNIRKKKSIHHYAVMYAECLCKKIERLNDKEVDSIVSRPLLDAACYDTYELVEIIVRRFPSLAYCYDRDSKNILHIAIEYRCENVFNLSVG
ncbi:uncharacterized protein [Solanum lycopersicum]|uniref:uncharacterized protein isoform X3 n=1 Tax=Solanum lycopersicum TaxID=4081 RepID=UPI00374940C6